MPKKEYLVHFRLFISNNTTKISISLFGKHELHE